MNVARATFIGPILAVGPDGLGPELCFQKVGQGSGAHRESKNKARLLLLLCGNPGGLWEHTGYGPSPEDHSFCFVW